MDDWKVVLSRTIVGAVVLYWTYRRTYRVVRRGGRRAATPRTALFSRPPTPFPLALPPPLPLPPSPSSSSPPTPLLPPQPQPRRGSNNGTISLPRNAKWTRLRLGDVRGPRSLCQRRYRAESARVVRRLLAQAADATARRHGEKVTAWLEETRPAPSALSAPTRPLVVFRAFDGRGQMHTAVFLTEAADLQFVARRNTDADVFDGSLITARLWACVQGTRAWFAPFEDACPAKAAWVPGRRRARAGGAGPAPPGRPPTPRACSPGPGRLGRGLGGASLTPRDDEIKPTTEAHLPYPPPPSPCPDVCP